MHGKLRGLFAATFLTVSAFALAASPVGTWKGKIDLSGVKMPTPQNAEQKAQMDKGLAMLRALNFTLNLKQDKTYVVTITNQPKGEKPQPPQTGKWSQSGNKITMNGKSGNSQTATLSANGKTLTVVPPNSNGMKLVFRKG